MNAEKIKRKWQKLVDESRNIEITVDEAAKPTASQAYEYGDWIPVSERLPVSGLVLACTPENVMVLAGWCEKEEQWIVPEWFGGANGGNRPRDFFTNWMPLPEPPST